MLLNLTFISSEEKSNPSSLAAYSLLKENFFFNQNKEKSYNLSEILKNSAKSIKNRKLCVIEGFLKKNPFMEFFKKYPKKEEFYIKCQNNFSEDPQIICVKYKEKPSNYDLKNLSKHLQKEKHNVIDFKIKNLEKTLNMEDKKKDEKTYKVCDKKIIWETSYSWIIENSLQKECFYSNKKFPEEELFPSKKAYLNALKEQASVITHRPLTPEEERKVRYKYLGFLIVFNKLLHEDYKYSIYLIKFLVQLAFSFWVSLYIGSLYIKRLKNEINSLERSLKTQNEFLQDQIKNFNGIISSHIASNEILEKSNNILRSENSNLTLIVGALKELINLFNISGNLMNNQN